MEEKQFDRTKLYVPVKFAYTTLFPYTRYLDKHNIEVSSSIIAEIGHSGDTHSVAEVKRMFCDVILYVVNTYFHCRGGLPCF